MYPALARICRCARRAVLIVSLAGVVGISTADMAWAKPSKEKAPEKAVKSYVFPYAIVILGVALGMILVLRPVKRADEPKQKAKDEQ
jgi:hypothetical protein